MEQNVQMTPDQILNLLKKVDNGEVFTPFGVGPAVFVPFSAGPRVFMPFGAGPTVRECESA